MMAVWYTSDLRQETSSMSDKARARLRRIWVRIKYLDQMIVDGYRTFRLWR